MNLEGKVALHYACELTPGALYNSEATNDEKINIIVSFNYYQISMSNKLERPDKLTSK